jgi:hypothetical protein
LASEDRGGAGWDTQSNKPKLIRRFEKRDCAIPGTAQNRSRIKRAPILLRKTFPALDPIMHEYVPGTCVIFPSSRAHQTTQF